MVIGVVDLTACCFPLPLYIYRIRYSYTYDTNFICRLVFLNYGFSVASGSLLTLIAVDRYRKICQPLKTQITPNGAVILSIVAVFISFVLSSFCFIFYGPVEELTVKGFNMTICTAYDTLKHSPEIKSYNGVVITYGTILLLTCVCVYINLLKVLCKFKHIDEHDRPNVIQEKESTGTASGDQDENGTGNDHQNMAAIPHDITASTQTLYNDKEYKRRMSRYNRALTVTITFIVATTISYAGCIISFVFFMFSESREINMRLFNELGAGYEILYNFHFVIHISNPIVYCFLDTKFRRKCADMYVKCCCCIFNCFRNKS